MPNKIGRNDPCPCGSGKKYKNCHSGSGSPAKLKYTPKTHTTDDLDTALCGYELAVKNAYAKLKSHIDGVLTTGVFRDHLAIPMYARFIATQSQSTYAVGIHLLEVGVINEVLIMHRPLIEIALKTHWAFSNTDGKTLHRIESLRCQEYLERIALDTKKPPQKLRRLKTNDSALWNEMFASARDELGEETCTIEFFSGIDDVPSVHRIAAMTSMDWVYGLYRECCGAIHVDSKFLDYFRIEGPDQWAENPMDQRRLFAEGRGTAPGNYWRHRFLLSFMQYRITIKALNEYFGIQDEGGRDQAANEYLFIDDLLTNYG